MKSSKHVETCFVRTNNDFDDKLTVFRMKNNFWTKIPKNGHCENWCFGQFCRSRIEVLKVAQLLAHVIFVSVSLVRENLTGLRENIKHKIRT